MKDIKHLILFDGVCNLCNGSVNYLIQKDKHKRLNFTTLQSETGQAMVQKFKLQNIDSIILIENDKAYTQSDAILRIGKALGGIYKLGYAFIIIPRFIRNAIYDFVARNRYKWFGQKDECMIPTPEIRERFI